MYENLDGPLNCLDTNRDGTMVAVAGRNVFKIMGIEDTRFVEKANFRVGKINLNLSACDVAWNPLEDHRIASAATNGAIVIWNMNMTNRSKQELVINQHRRTVTKVNFHANESSLLLSGSQDWTIKLHDLRRSPSQVTVFKTQEPVRDIQFCPHQYFMFAAALDNGNVQLWDIRNSRKNEKEFNAHGGPVFGLNWHLEDRNWLATCGRDKMIKVWDLQNPQKVKNIHLIQTIAAVSRIRWRPQRKHHIASCALLVDFTVNIWDVRRPYIPFAAFSNYKDVVTGIVWKHNDPHVFLSSSKDGCIRQHLFRDATRPADNANPVGVAINVHGNVMHSSADKLSTNPDYRLTPNTPRISRLFSREPTRSDLFTSVDSLLWEYENNHEDESVSMDWFVQSAQRYQLTGKPVEDLCEHNAKVADNLHRPQIAQTWRILKLMYTKSPASPIQPQTKASPFTPKADASKDKDNDKGTDKTSEVKSGDLDKKDDSSSGSDDEISDQNEAMVDPGTNLARIASGLRSGSHGDLFFGDGDIDQQVLDYEQEILQDSQDWSLSNEAFQLRTEIEDKGGGALDALAQPKLLETPSTSADLEASNKQVAPKKQDLNVKQEILAATPFYCQLPVWDPSCLVTDMLKQYAKLGDVQMAVSVLIVLGNKVRQSIDDLSLEQWFMSYIDLLGRFSMWTIANEIVKLSNIQPVERLNQHSTSINISCSRCMKQIPRTRPGWLCERCHNYVHTCAVCHHPVKGLFVWCQGCAHGGHIQHITEWLQSHKQCPAGCGHQCEYT